MDPVWIVIRAFCLGLGVILLDMLWLQVVRHRRCDKPLGAWRHAMSPLLLLMGGGILWRELATGLSSIAGGGRSLWMQAGLLLYGTSVIVYGELRSLLSRGYSLRILLDLWSQGQESSLERLQTSYGGGMGLSGLLQKRLCGLAAWRLLDFEEDRVGPLTLLGRCVAAVTAQWRALLRLRRVG